MIAAKVSSKSPISLSQSGTVEYVHVVLLDNSGAIQAVLFDDECYQFDYSLKVRLL
jgi:hypothetical protein